MSRILKWMTRGRAAFWSALVLPWLLIWVFPGARALCIATLNGQLSGRWWGEQVSYSDLVKQYPDDIQVQVSITEKSAGDDSDELYAPPDAFTPYDATVPSGLARLVQRFPHAVLPCADCVRLSLGATEDARLGGDFENPIPPPYLTPSPEHTTSNQYGMRLPNFSSAQLRQAITLARHGQGLEPDNAYFDWALVCLLLSGDRDNEALTVLHAASLKGHYDDHSVESIAAAVHTLELVRSAPLEHKLSLCMRNGANLTTRFTHAAKLLSWRAWKAERSGHHRQAIALRADLARIGNLLLHDHNTVETQLFGAEIQRIAWGGNPQRTFTYQQMPPASRNAPGALLNLHAQSFAHYVRSHGNEAVALETLQFAQNAIKLRQLLRSSDYQSEIRCLPLHNPVFLGLLNQTRTLFWCSENLLWLAPSLLCAYIGLSLLLIRTARTSGETLPRTLPLAALCFALMLVAILGVKSEILVADSLRLGFRENTRPTNDWPTMSIGAFFLIPVLLPALFWSVHAGLQRRNWWRSQPRERESPLLPRDMRPLVWAFFLVSVALGTLLGGLLGLIVTWKQPTGIFYDPVFGIRFREADFLPLGFALALSCAALWFGGWLLKWRFFIAREERPFFQGALRRYRMTFGTLLIVTSWAYLLTLWLSFIPRHKADQLLLPTLQQGVAVALPISSAAPANSQRKTP